MKSVKFTLSIILISLLIKANAQESKSDFIALDTFYYPFHHGIQMIKIDSSSFWVQKYYSNKSEFYTEKYKEMYPIPPNVYLFRNTNGKVINSYNLNNSPNYWRENLSDTSQLVHKGYKNLYNLNIYQYKRSIKDDYNGFYQIRQKGKYGLIDSMGKLVVPFKYQYITRLSSTDLLIVRKKRKLGIIDKHNKQVVKIKYESIYETETDSMLFFEKNNTVVLAFNHKSLEQFKLNQLEEIVATQRGLDKTRYVVLKENNIGVLNEIFEEVLPIEFSYMEDPKNEKDMTRVCKEGKWGFINSSYEIIIPCTYDYALNRSENNALVLDNGEFYTINNRGEKIKRQNHVPYRANSRDSLSILSTESNKYSYFSKNMYGIFNAETNTFLVPLKYDYIQELSDHNKTPYGYLIFHEENYCVVNASNRSYSKCLYDEILPPKDSLIVVKKDGKYGVISAITFKKVIDFKYSYLRYNDAQKSFFYSKDNESGVVNYENKTIFRTEFHFLFNFTDNYKHKYYIVSLNSKYGVIDVHGKLIIPCLYDKIFTGKYQEYLGFNVLKDGTKQLINW